MADNICPTYAAGTVSVVSSNNNDFYAPTITGATNTLGYINQSNYENTVGSPNNSWNNGALSNTVLPTFSNSLVDFGATGRQS